MGNKHYPTAFLVVIAAALYFMYGEQFSLSNIDFLAYKEACIKYQSAKDITAFSNNEVLGLVNKINYIIPEEIADLKDPLKIEIKACALELSKRLSH